MRRNTFLKIVVHSFGAIIAGVVAAPSVLTAFSPVRLRRPETWVRLGPVDLYKAGETTKAVLALPRRDHTQPLQPKGVYVWRTPEDSWVVFSRNCTDLGCPVTWDPGSEVFFCPCHGGIFARDGRRMAGPPRRPLDRYASRVRNGMLEVDISSLSAVH
jgi:menaquinol-cytochrome c reductase iron-sulfur subunit